MERFTAELHKERQAHEDDIIHSHDDYVKLRGRVLHCVKQELSLLEDGLLALRRDPPKVHVMDGHAKRAINGLKCEVQRPWRGRLR